MIPTALNRNCNIWLKIRPSLYAHILQPHVAVWILSQMSAGNVEIDENADFVGGLKMN